MTFQPKARYFPEDVKAYKAPRHPMQFVWMTLAACLAFTAYMEQVPKQINAAAQRSTARDTTAPSKEGVGPGDAALAAPTNAAPQSSTATVITAPSKEGVGRGAIAASAPMPAATPIFEPAHALGRLSSPVQCSGRSRHGLWIAHAGDRKRTGRRCI